MIFMSCDETRNNWSVVININFVSNQIHLIIKVGQQVIHSSSTLYVLYIYIYACLCNVLYLPCFSEPILEDLEMPHRYRPENLEMLCEATG